MIDDAIWIYQVQLQSSLACVWMSNTWCFHRNVLKVLVFDGGHFFVTAIAFPFASPSNQETGYLC
jgi:hypothetical protein